MPSILLLLALLLPQDDPLSDLCDRFSNFDADRDGVVEIEKLAPLDAPGSMPQVLVLVEPRILDDDLTTALRRYTEDLRADGWTPRLVSAKVYAGERHQDGRTLLALRAFLQEIRKANPKFAGAVLVGSFPEAQLVRMYNWRKKGPVTIFKGKPNERKFETPVEFVTTSPELVAHRCELILCDLDGKWEDLYRQERQRLPTLLALFPGGVPPRGGISHEFEIGSRTFEDFFFVNDGRYEASEVLGPKDEVVGLRFVPFDEYENSECAPPDFQSKNPMARPDIVVSRINARGVALRPREGLLDKSGKPQRAPYVKELWEPDPILERRLLVEYFERNHRYRKGEFAKIFKTASIAHGLGSGRRETARAGLKEEGDHVGTPATLLDLVAWLRKPAILRDFRAHSARWGSVFGKVEIPKLEEACGGAPWAWTKKGTDLVPSFAGCKGDRADFALYRTLWENRRMPDGASFYYHTGCESISPAHSEDRPYNHPDYGRFQGAESILFYAQGLALVGRAKVFYDAPRGFYDALADGKSFGEAWVRYFDVEWSAKGWDEVGGGIGRKRAYFWSVLGDWTLRLKS